MKSTFRGMLVAVVLLSGAAMYQGGFELLFDGLFRGVRMLVTLFPLLVVAFFVAGLIFNLIPRELISRWLGEQAGWKGPVLGALAGAIVPGGPFFFYPLMATLLVSGAQIGTVISFVTGKTAWSLGRIPLELAIVGVDLTLIRLAVTFLFPILLGILVNTLLPGLTEKIRLDAEALKQTNKGGDSRA